MEELIPEPTSTQAQPLCSHGDVAELFFAETNSTMLGEACNYLQVKDIDSSSEFALEDEDNSRISGDEFELLDFADSNTFEQFVKDEDACSDFFSDCEDSDEIDSECIPEQCEAESDDRLYSGAPITSSSSVVLLVSFVFKHKLTHEAFNDLLAVIEAHCPRPNNCKTTVNKLFQFLSQAKGNVVKLTSVVSARHILAGMSKETVIFVAKVSKTMVDSSLKYLLLISCKSSSQVSILLCLL